MATIMQQCECAERTGLGWGALLVAGFVAGALILCVAVLKHYDDKRHGWDE